MDAARSLPPSGFASDPPAEAAGRATPVMEQYIEIKAANPDCLLFYRMGDFYELFFEDAEIAARALGIVLTKRGKHLGRDIPMCGVPVIRADEYLHRLIAQGHRVAVCEQMEDPALARKRGSKSVVKRDVVRLVTPGTLTEDTLLDARRNNYLLALARARVSSTDEASRFALAWIDISTGEFRIAECDRAGLAAELARLEPSEIIVSDALYSDTDLAPFLRSLPAVTPLTRDVFDGATAERRLASYFSVATSDAFGALSRLELTAAAACITYVERTQLGQRPPLSPPVREAEGATLALDLATRSNLELIRTLGGERRGSLLAAIDRTVTAAGSRLLSQRLAAPLTDPAAIGERHDAVAHFVAETGLRSSMRAKLKGAPDIARSLSRLVVGRGGPRDLAAIRDGIEAAASLAAELTAGGAVPLQVQEAATALRGPDAAIARELTAALDDELPLFKRDGGFVRAGYDAALDEARALRKGTREVIAALEARYAGETGVRTLKVKHNNQLGYFVEVPSQHAEKLRQPPLNATFIHRMTMAGQVRFTSTELGELEVQDRQRRRPRARHRACDLRAAGGASDRRDEPDQGSGGRAGLARRRRRARAARGRAGLCAARGRRLARLRHRRRAASGGGAGAVTDGGPFVANDCDLSPRSRSRAAGRICLLTGPNMAGKSTFLRQNALIAIMAQMGSFVPARRARIGVVDRLFSRVGAADDLARGRSTFMVEMVETAAILNQAGERSLVILDEIGRGTATFDGLSIAWATIEHLHAANRCRALFATHFHELTVLSTKLPRLFNSTVRVKEWQGEVVFLHEVVPGAADRSYGIQVAKLAGLPASVIERAKLVLAKLEAEDRATPPGFDDLPLFAATAPPTSAKPTIDTALAEVVAALAAINPDELSPREALEALYALKAKSAAKG